ncbi:uncharacterized protein KNAG_0E03450 [Huiozyma naganishii CBS 8797]|uniref:Uncharacterized protein n=1 Tax=Huiozyma naganishii (strain ATCC MYA-139 / BCRC 22969 / CBS 8797 / KCTC 17520 / NBRC 10181 / NCYC 3082 / Yp74L-3) TaxID=1071383 RepID=J7RZG5_HUIN7|nr:hypothetical protein KNAG_0E03450 [Kazachstania naganishii CBS 8797]CCK70602.1 hypothetical protein KNAG_0E03450 [Kazachstania naganishii CBS 8797]
MLLRGERNNSYISKLYLSIYSPPYIYIYIYIGIPYCVCNLRMIRRQKRKQKNCSTTKTRTSSAQTGEFTGIRNRSECSPRRKHRRKPEEKTPITRGPKRPETVLRQHSCAVVLRFRCTLPTLLPLVAAAFSAAPDRPNRKNLKLPIVAVSPERNNRRGKTGKEKTRHSAGNVGPPAQSSPCSGRGGTWFGPLNSPFSPLSLSLSSTDLLASRPVEFVAGTGTESEVRPVA